MAFIADILLAAGSIGAAFYCFILGRRLKRFNNLESGMGGAVAMLSAQVDDLEKTIDSSKISANSSAEKLQALTERAEDVRRQLEIQMASLHDIIPQHDSSEEKPEKPPGNTSEDTSDKTKDEENLGAPMFTRRKLREAS